MYSLGPPQAVDLKCICREILYIECTWTRPYTIEGIKLTSYNVTITKDDKTLHVYERLITNNHFSYLSGTYNVSVTAIVEESLEGEVSVTRVNNIEGKLSDVIKKVKKESMYKTYHLIAVVSMNYSCTIEPMKNKNNRWMVNYTINVS